MNLFTTQEKLSVVEGLIEAFRRSGGDSDDNRYRLRVMAAIASDLRGRLEQAPNIALTELERRIAAVVRSKTPLGYGNGPLVGVGEELIGRWPIVKQALERFGADS